jgi:GMP reductase
MEKHKVLTCLHKYYTCEDLLNASLNKEYYAVSTGINRHDLDNLDKIMETVDPKFICVDVANGYMLKMIETCKQIREKYPDKIIIAGNVCTSEGVLELVIEGKADIVKVGIGSGSCCTTRKQTGIGMPQLSAVIECADMAHGMDAHIISDGGLQVIGDFSKAYGAGADFVMSGSMFAGHDESGGKMIEENGKIYKVFYGMSSDTAMSIYSGGVAKYKSSEGKTVKIEHRGPVEKTILDIQGGIRSTMTYIGAKQIKDLSKCVTFIKTNRQYNEVFVK